MATDNHENRHVLHSHLVGGFDACSCGSWVCGIDDLAVEGLSFVVGGGHLVHKDILYSGAIGDGVAIKYNCGWGGCVEGTDGVAVFPKGWVEGLDELGGS